MEQKGSIKLGDWPTDIAIEFSFLQPVEFSVNFSGRLNTKLSLKASNQFLFKFI